MASAAATHDGLGKHSREEDSYEDDHELSDLLRTAESPDTTPTSVEETSSDTDRSIGNQPSDPPKEANAIVPQTNIVLSNQRALDAYNKCKSGMTDMLAEMQTKSDEIIQQLQEDIASLQNTNDTLRKSFAIEICNLEQGHATEIHNLKTTLKQLTDQKNVLGRYYTSMKRLVKDQPAEY